MYIVHVHISTVKRITTHMHTHTHARSHIRTHVCTDMSIDAFKAADEKIAPNSIVLFVFKLFSVNSISILLHGFPVLFVLLSLLLDILIKLSFSYW